VAGEEAPDRAVAHDKALIRERSTQVFDRHIGRPFDHGEDHVLVRLDPLGSAISAGRARAGLAPFRVRARAIG
jgi:hypothetical protein